MKLLTKILIDKVLLNSTNEAKKKRQKHQQNTGQILLLPSDSMSSGNMGFIFVCAVLVQVKS